jgi:hypothetical protein
MVSTVWKKKRRWWTTHLGGFLKPFSRQKVAKVDLACAEKLLVDDELGRRTSQKQAAHEEVCRRLLLHVLSCKEKGKKDQLLVPLADREGERRRVMTY